MKHPRIGVFESSIALPTITKTKSNITQVVERPTANTKSNLESKTSMTYNSLTQVNFGRQSVGVGKFSGPL